MNFDYATKVDVAKAHQELAMSDCMDSRTSHIGSQMCQQLEIKTEQ